MYKIGDFSKKVDISIKTLRYYDEINLFKPSYQDFYTGYRYYENSQINEIKKIKKLKELNLSLQEIKLFLDSKDINIIINKERELIMALELIKNYVDETKYKIEEGTYEDYIKWNGLKAKDRPIALELKDNVCKYYMVFKDGEYYSEVIVFKDEKNLINLNITYGINDYLNVLLDYLKKDYTYLTFKSNENMYKNLDVIRENCNCVKEYTEIIDISEGNNLELTNIEIEL